MLNINNLENRHRKYKFKSYIPYIVTFISILVIIGTLLRIDYSNMITDSKTKIIIPIKKEIQQTSTIQDKKYRDIKPIQKAIIIAPKKVKKSTVISPSLNFMKKMQSTTPVPYYTNEPKVKKTKIKKQVITKVRKVQKTKVKVERIEEVPTLSIQKKSMLKIKRNKNNDDIQHVIKRFKVNNNPALSLFVAKKYYQIGKYKKAYNYALITNQINSNIEASWIVFAKSLMKLNEQEMAIKTLKKYIDESHSSRAKILLDEIQSGKFK